VSRGPRLSLSPFCIEIATIGASADASERHDPSAQDEFREDAHTLLAHILDKNNDADNRRVRQASPYSIVPLLTNTDIGHRGIPRRQDH
jgi:hypothetical protein